MVKSSQEQGARSQNQVGYRRVVAFQKADLMAKRAYRLARKVAKEDRWLASQLSRAAVSAPLNIAEGHGRGTIRDFLRFLETASSSINEVEYLLDFLTDAGIIDDADLVSIEPVRREAAATLTGLIKALRKRAGEEKDWNRKLVSDRHADYTTDEIDEY